MADHSNVRRTQWFTREKFRPTTPPANTVPRSVLHDRLRAGADKRLTLVVGPAGSGKTVLLSSWAAARPAGATSWLSCDQADVNPVRFWTALIEAFRVAAPWFGATAADLLAIDRAMSPDVISSIADDAAKLLPGSAVIVDDFQCVSPRVARDMSHLIEQWPAEITQLVLASRSDPPLPLQRLRLAGEIAELGDDDLRFSLAESRDLLVSLGAELQDERLAVLHQRTEGWAAALHLAALALAGSGDSARVSPALAVLGQAVSKYFIAEVLDQQPADVAQFMLDISILGQVTAESCAAVTGRTDAVRMLRILDTSHLHLVALDHARTRFRYRHPVREILRAELRLRDPLREQELQLRAAEWFESSGRTQSAILRYLAAQRADRAFALIERRVMSSFLADPVWPGALDLSRVNLSTFADAPEQVVAVAAHLLLSGDTRRGGQYLDLLDRSRPTMASGSRLRARIMTLQAFRHAQFGDAERAVSASLAARSMRQRTHLVDEWDVALQKVLLSAYMWLEDFESVEREAASALANPSASEPVRLVLVPGARALASFECGRLTVASEWAQAAETMARRLGFNRHIFAVGYLRTLAGLALERLDLETADDLTEQALSIARHRRPAHEFLLLLDRGQIFLARGDVRRALVTVDAARRVLSGAKSVLLARADDLEALIRLSAGDLLTAADLAERLPDASRRLMLARIALAAGAHDTAAQHLQSLSAAELTLRRALLRRLLVAATAIERADPATGGVVGGIIETARDEGYVNTLVTAAPQVTSYLVEHLAQMRQDQYIRRLGQAAMAVRASKQGASKSGDGLIEPLTEAELHVLRLLPTSSYQQIAATLYVSRNTVKTHLRAVYRKLGVVSRSDAIARALELGLI